MKKLLLLLTISIAFFSCRKNLPEIKAKPNYGEYYAINKQSGVFGYPGDGVYYTGALSWSNLISHPSGNAKLTFEVSNDGKILPIEINWKFVAGTANNTYSYFTWTKVQPKTGDVIRNAKFTISYD